jgi:hypothetical protein
LETTPTRSAGTPAAISDCLVPSEMASTAATSRAARW